MAGLQGDRGDQQGPGGADLQRGRLCAGGGSIHGGAETGQDPLMPVRPQKGIACDAFFDVSGT